MQCFAIVKWCTGRIFNIAHEKSGILLRIFRAHRFFFSPVLSCHYPSYRRYFSVFVFENTIGASIVYSSVEILELCCTVS